MRTLIAGFGNVLRGDDGFGVEVIRRLRESGRPLPDVDLMEVGTAGILLAQELLTPYDRLIVVDAMTRGGEPGSLYVSEVQSVESATEVDLHLAVPARALAVAKALGALPRRTFIVGCEPAEVDQLTMDLTPRVAQAVETALDHVWRLLDGAPAVDRVDGLKQRDEVLQIMFWLQGEGFGPDVAPADVLRFADDELMVRAALGQLVDEGYADRVDGDRYRLTALGMREGPAGSSTSSSPTSRGPTANAEAPAATVATAAPAGARRDHRDLRLRHRAGGGRLPLPGHAAGEADRPSLHAGAAEPDRQSPHRALHRAAQPAGRRQLLHRGRPPGRPRGGRPDRAPCIRGNPAASRVLAHRPRPRALRDPHRLPSRRPSALRPRNPSIRLASRSSTILRVREAGFAN
jgi:hydrogenase maturation protease